MGTIVIAEDERDLSNVLRRQLEAEGHRVHQAFDGLAAVDLVEREKPDLLLLDWMLPGLNGLEVTRRVRQRSITPILMLTARAEEVDRVLGLEVGADDYLTKPFSMPELLARVRALFRRVELLRGAEQPGGTLLRDGPLQVDGSGRSATLHGTPLELTPKEFDLLELLVGHAGRAFSREYLLERVWGYEFGGADRTVDTHVLRLRKKLGALGDRIETVWGVGYRFARPTARGRESGG
jgi:DNA-binding response OmpR family regulator